MIGKGVWTLSKQAFSEWSDDKASQLAAALAYYAAFAIAPLLVIAVAVLGFVLHNNQSAKEQIVHEVTQVANGISPDLIRQLLDHASNFGSSVWATVVGIVLTLYGAFYLFTVVQQSLNTIWDVKPRQDLPWWRSLLKRTASLVVVALIAAILLASLFVTTWITGYARGVTGGGPWGTVAAYGIDVVGSLIIYTIVFALVFKLVPDVKIRWLDVWVGAIVTAVLFILGSYALGFYLSRGSTTSVFGAAGAFAALLIWVYYSAQIFFFGAEVTQVYARRTGTRIQPNEYAIRLDERDLQKLGKKSPPDTGDETRNEHREPLALHLPVRQPNRGSGKLVAVGGMAAGLLVGAAGWLQRRRDPVRQAKIEFTRLRLDKLDRRLDRLEESRHLSRTMDVQDRLAKTDQELLHFLHAARETR